MGTNTIEQVVVLAGGRGTRLRPLTDILPKVLAPVNGRPFLEYQLRLLKKQGFQKVLLLVGYRAEAVIGQFGDGCGLDLEITYSIEKDLLGTGGALRNAFPYLDDRFILLNGDTYLRLSFQALSDEAQRRDISAYIVASSGTSAAPNLKVDLDGRVCKYSKSESHDCNYVDAGCIVLARKTLDLLPSGFVSLEETLYPALIAERRLWAMTIEEPFYDMGDAERLAVVSDILK